jgi:hypothetical protein
MVLFFMVLVGLDYSGLGLSGGIWGISLITCWAGHGLSASWLTLFPSVMVVLNDNLR